MDEPNVEWVSRLWAAVRVVRASTTDKGMPLTKAEWEVVEANMWAMALNCSIEQERLLSEIAALVQSILAERAKRPRLIAADGRVIANAVAPPLKPRGNEEEERVELLALVNKSAITPELQATLVGLLVPRPGMPWRARHKTVRDILAFMESGDEQEADRVGDRRAVK
jgi:hypothetical protein